MKFSDSDFVRIFLIQLEDFLREHFFARSQNMSARSQHLVKAVEYSLFSGGKRFRPMVCALTAQSLEVGIDRILPWAAAIECVHTYSLIHDDLPCMDNDDFRRGLATSHRVFGESTALLAGDALLTEAFMIISKYYSHTPEVATQLTELIAGAAGYSGMIAGQIEDLTMAGLGHVAQSDVEAEKIEESALLQMHDKKTGGLISASAFGVSLIARSDDKMKNTIKKFGAYLGLAFQLTDDLLDFDLKNLENSSLPKHIGLEATRRRLEQVTEAALSEIKNLKNPAPGLRELIKHNVTRGV